MDESIVWLKPLLSIDEASVYFGISQTRLREVISRDASADYVLFNGAKILIKKQKFEQFLMDSSSI